MGTTKTASKLAEEVITWLESKGVSLPHRNTMINTLTEKYNCVAFNSVSAEMTQDERCEFFGVMIDKAEDFLEEIGITADKIPNDEREDENSAIIYGSDYNILTGRFAEILKN